MAAAVRGVCGRQLKNLPPAAGREAGGEVEHGGKKTAAAVHQEVTRELDTLLPRIFVEHRKAGELDLEAVELAFRTALHSAGAAGLSELLREPGPIPTTAPCPCGGRARYKDMRLKPILTVLGPAHMLRAYYW